MKPIMTLPCKNRHSDMEKNEKGYHCKNCDHVLKDFRNSNEEEINRALLENSGKTCGIFNRDQLNYKTSHIQAPVFKTIGLSLLGILGFLGPVISSCETVNDHTENKKNVFNLLRFPLHIKGKVTDENTGKLLPNFNLDILQHGKLIKKTKTDENGYFDILITKNDLDEEVFSLAIGGDRYENDTLTTKLSKFKNKKVRLSIKAEASSERICAPGMITPVVIDENTIEGEMMIEETGKVVTDLQDLGEETKD